MSSSMHGNIRLTASCGQVTISPAYWPRLCSGVPYFTTLIIAWERPMSSIVPLTRRSAILGIAGTALFAMTKGRAADEQIITVHKDPSCGCCSGWVKHLQQAGFAVATIETADLEL